MEERAAAGARLKKAIHIARAQADLTSDMAVSVVARVSYDTLMNWYSGRTTPRPHELRKVAKALGVPYADLWSAYEDIPTEEVPLTDALRELIPELRALVAELRGR